ncbi:hypothetical protein ACFSNO_20700 [Streptomyces cirratus]
MIRPAWSRPRSSESATSSSSRTACAIDSADRRSSRSEAVCPAMYRSADVGPAVEELPDDGDDQSDGAGDDPEVQVPAALGLPHASATPPSRITAPAAAKRWLVTKLLRAWVRP